MSTSTPSALPATFRRSFLERGTYEPTGEPQPVRWVWPFLLRCHDSPHRRRAFFLPGFLFAARFPAAFLVFFFAVDALPVLRLTGFFLAEEAVAFLVRPRGRADSVSITAWAAANRAIGTRYGLHET